jgi:hypothetical protein
LGLGSITAAVQVIIAADITPPKYAPRNKRNVHTREPVLPDDAFAAMAIGIPRNIAAKSRR